MPNSSFSLRIVTPERVFFEGPVVSIIAPGTSGYLGVLIDHAPLVTTVGKGKFTFRTEEGRIQRLKIDGGFLEVLDNEARLLTDSVESLNV